VQHDADGEDVGAAVDVSIRICSGDMYETFPFIVPAWVWVSRIPSATRAMPKSRIFTPPWNDNIRFDGETSR